ncbi:hypothetical protein, partial [Neobacillus vireti]
MVLFFLSGKERRIYIEYYNLDFDLFRCSVGWERASFLGSYFAHFHNLVNLVISACLEGGKIHLYRDGSGQTTGSAASPFKRALI